MALILYVISWHHFYSVSTFLMVSRSHQAATQPPAEINWRLSHWGRNSLFAARLKQAEQADAAAVFAYCQSLGILVLAACIRANLLWSD